MNPYLYIGIGVVVLIVGIFFLTWFLNKKTPVPKGCENLRIGEEACSSCLNTECGIKMKLDLKKIESEIEEDNK